MAIGNVMGTAVGSATTALLLITPEQDSVPAYTGNTIQATFKNYIASAMNVTGDTGTTAGNYNAIFTPTGTYVWSDTATQESRTVPWTIARQTISTKPSTSAVTYPTKSPTWSGYDTVKMTIGGDTTKDNAGTYNATFTPTANYQWATSVQTNTTAATTVAWTINPLLLTKPSLTNTSKTYSGSAQSPTVNDYNSTYENQSGTASATNAGNYTVTWSLKNTSNTKWSGNTTVAVSGTWSIARQAINTAPSQKNTLTYSGSTQSPTWNNYSDTQLTIGGTYQNQTNAGTYNATFTPTSNYQWSTSVQTNTTAAKTITWTISKATPTITLSSTAVSVSATSPNATVTVTKSTGVGTVSVSSSDTTVATASISGTTITVTGSTKQSGTATITVSGTSSNTTNYNAPSSKTFTVTVSNWVASKLSDNSATQIKAACVANIHSTTWNVGDTTKAITINGTVGCRTFSNYTGYAYILGFDHCKEAETAGKSSITFCLGRQYINSVLRETAFVDNELYVSVPCK